MKTLSGALKRMLAGLAHQDATEFVPLADKLGALRQVPARGVQPGPFRPGFTLPRKRVGLISDGQAKPGVLNYAVQACQRQEAQLDLLLHGSVQPQEISALEAQVRNQGLACRSVVLPENAAEGILEHLSCHLSLIYLVASPDDTAVRALVDKPSPTRGKHRLPVPLVLIEAPSPAFPAVTGVL